MGGKGRGWEGLGRVGEWLGECWSWKVGGFLVERYGY